jgi:hypothetical protein
MNVEAGTRYLCSNLVSVHLPEVNGGEREVVGNLEEIYPSGAYLNVEEPIEVGLPMRVVCCDIPVNYEMKGVSAGSHHDALTGYYIEVEFAPASQWSPKLFRPKHLMLARGLVAGEQVPTELSCCDRGACPMEVVSRVLQPEGALAERVRNVAQRVAVNCGELTEDQAVQCFGALFGAGRDCRLFAEFQDAFLKRHGAASSR